MLTRRDFAILGGAALGGAGIGRGMKAPAAIEPFPRTDPMALVNPQFREALRQMLKEGGDSPWTASALPELRKLG